MRSLARAVCMVVVAVLGATTTTICEAAPQVTVVVKRAGPTEAEGFEVRLRSELRAAGFDVVLVTAAANTPEELEALAVQTQSVAAISVDQPAGSVVAKVWVTERMTGKTLFRTVRPEKISPEAPAIVALRTVELLRASLLELNEKHPPRGTMPVPASVKAWIAPDRPTTPAPQSQARAWGVAAGLTVLGAPGGIPVGLGPCVGFLWHPSAGWTSELRWEGPFFGSAESAVGTASIRQELLTWRIRFEPWVQATISPWASLGVGGHHLNSQGSARTPYFGRSDGAYTLVLLAGLGLSINTGKGFFVVPEIDLARAATRPVVHFADGSSVSTGRPFVTGGLALEYTW